MLTLSRERARQIVAVVHIDSERASSAAAILALTFYQFINTSDHNNKELRSMDYH